MAFSIQGIQVPNTKLGRAVTEIVWNTQDTEIYPSSGPTCDASPSSLPVSSDARISPVLGLTTRSRVACVDRECQKPGATYLPLSG